jgi:hypothetical protein
MTDNMNQKDKRRAEIFKVISELATVRFNIEVLALNLKDPNLLQEAEKITAMMRTIAERLEY